jgi:hypothetical protein
MARIENKAIAKSASETAFMILLLLPVGLDFNRRL